MKLLLSHICSTVVAGNEKLKNIHHGTHTQVDLLAGAAEYTQKD